VTRIVESARKHGIADEDERIARALKAIEEFDPSQHPGEDVIDLRAIAEATDAVQAAEYRLREAIGVARKLHGRSWGQIAISLGVSRQAANERWAKKIDG
jgi:hypothetical protein